MQFFPDDGIAQRLPGDGMQRSGWSLNGCISSMVFSIEGGHARSPDWDLLSLEKMRLRSISNPADWNDCEISGRKCSWWLRSFEKQGGYV